MKDASDGLKVCSRRISAGRLHAWQQPEACLIPVVLIPQQRPCGDVGDAVRPPVDEHSPVDVLWLLHVQHCEVRLVQGAALNIPRHRIPADVQGHLEDVQAL